eukprot:4311417-Lingulodinium_polyedra.AAC.1
MLPFKTPQEAVSPRVGGFRACRGSTQEAIGPLKRQEATGPLRSRRPSGKRLRACFAVLRFCLAPLARLRMPACLLARTLAPAPAAR